MSKNKKKNKKKSMFQKKNVLQVTLKEKLDSIYKTIDMRTTCDGVCECCKVAMPQLNYCEYSQLVVEIWDKASRQEKIDLICKSVEYFCKNEFDKWQKQSLIKPCMFLSSEKKCKYYDSRPLNCRLYGLWPEEEYNRRVDRFEKAYNGYLTREELPLNKQCPYVKLVNPEVKITMEGINKMFDELDELDKSFGNFSNVQVEQKENYRAFHDWLLWSIFGEQWLSTMTTFVLAADKVTLEDQIEKIQKEVSEKLQTINL